MKYAILLTIAALLATAALKPDTANANIQTSPTANPTPTKTVKTVAQLTFTDGPYDGKAIVKTDEEWKAILTPAEYHVMREEGTERPYTGKLLNNKKRGTYHCNACGLALFKSQTKYDSQTGWPSFYQPIYKKNVTEKREKNPGDDRIEVECARCGAHLGHVFNDGPQPTGLRYCMNSVSLKFKPFK